MQLDMMVEQKNNLLNLILIKYKFKYKFKCNCGSSF